MSKRSILVIDDEAEIRESLSDALADEGYTVEVAANGDEALARLGRMERPCVVILDLIMPRMSGVDFYQAMQANPQLSGIPVLVSTSDPTQAPAGLPVMRKPVNLDRLIDLVESLFAKVDPGGSPGSGRRPRQAMPRPDQTGKPPRRSSRPDRLGAGLTAMRTASN